MNGAFSDYQVEQWLNNRTYWVSLHYGSPIVDGAYASEIFGGSYSRQRVQMTSPDSRAIYNADDIVWRGIPQTRITHIAGWDKQYNGDMLWWAKLESPVTILDGKGFILTSGILALSMS